MIVAAYKNQGKTASIDIVPFGRSIHDFLLGKYPFGFFDENTLKTVDANQHKCVPFFKYHAVLFYNKMSNQKFSTETTLSSLKGRYVGMLNGNEHERIVLEKLGLIVVAASSHRALFKMLELNRIQYVSTVALSGLAAIYKHFPQNQRSQFSVWGKPYYEGKAGLCFHHKLGDSLKQDFEKFMVALNRSGEFKSLAMKRLNKIVGDEAEEILEKIGLF